MPAELALSVCHGLMEKHAESDLIAARNRPVQAMLKELMHPRLNQLLDGIDEIGEEAARQKRRLILSAISDLETESARERQQQGGG